MSLLIAFTVCEHEVQMFTELCSWIRELGGVSHFDALVGFTPGVEAKCREALVDLRQSFHQVDVMELKERGLKWPQAANFSFNQICIKALEYQGKHRSFWYFESDLLPLTSEWASRMRTQHESSRMLYSGPLSPTWMKNLKTGQLYETGFHISGHGVYPIDVFNRIPIIPFLPDMLDAFDIILANYIYNPKNPEIGIRANCTELIFNAWQSCSYKREADGRLSFIRTGFSECLSLLTARHVTSDAVLVHGCKDSSLYRLLRSERDAKYNLQDKTTLADVPVREFCSLAVAPSPTGTAQTSPAIQLPKAVRPHKPYAKHGVRSVSKRKKKVETVNG